MPNPPASSASSLPSADHWPPVGEIEIAPASVAALLEEKAPFRLIDCREEDEWELTRIEQAHLLPLSEFGERFSQFLPDPGERLVIHCHHGVRSGKAARFLRTKGYSNVWSMARGIEGWSTEIDPSVPRY